MIDGPVMTLIQQIRTKRVDPKTLATEDRRRCVEFLRVEGMQISEIAQILGRTERTILRDLSQIREENSVSRDPAMVERVVGDMLQQAESSRARLRRISREPAASAMERLMAEQSVWKVTKECVETLQSVGYIPRMPTGVVANIHQHVEIEPVAGYDELLHRMTKLKTVVEDSENDRAIARLTDEVKRGRLEARIDQLPDDVVPEEDAS